MPAAKKPAKILSIDDILAADDLPSATVDCPEWGGGVKVRALSRQEVVDSIEKAIGDDTGEVDLPVLQMEFVRRGLDLSEDRIAQLNRKHPAPIKRIESRVRELSGIGEDEDIPT